MRILLLTHSFNGLAQRLFVELRRYGHDVSVEFDINDAVTAEAVELFRPDIVLAPFLKRAIPEAIWRRHLCLIVHPGPPGDRGPSSLDRAILDGVAEWGVTVLQAEAEMDAGPVWASAGFPMRRATKSSLYRNEITEAAVSAVFIALDRIGRKDQPEPVPLQPMRPALTQAERAIDWSDDGTETVLRKIAASDGAPGVRCVLAGREVLVHDAHAAPGLGGPAGSVIARSGPAIAVATHDGAVWIGRLRDGAGAHPFKLPATDVLGDAVSGAPEIALDSGGGYREIRYEQRGPVGILHFAFLNGAMGTAQCERLLAAYREALARDTRVLVLAGGPDFWSNGMDLNRIEAADSAADESWRNINALDDLAEAILRTETHLTVAALQGNAGAGGVFLARACDEVWMRRGVVLNPHYKDMGNLFGSEFWTYSLPRHTGAENAERIAKARLPMGSKEALELGLADAGFGSTPDAFFTEALVRAETLADSDDFEGRLAGKRARRAADEAEKPLARYRAEELERMRLNFYGFDPSYHIARYNFVARVPKSRTPVTIARHRDARADHTWRNAS